VPGAGAAVRAGHGGARGHPPQRRRRRRGCARGFLAALRVKGAWCRGRPGSRSSTSAAAPSARVRARGFHGRPRSAPGAVRLAREYVLGAAHRAREAQGSPGRTALDSLVREAARPGEGLQLSAHTGSRYALAPAVVSALRSAARSFKAPAQTLKGAPRPAEALWQHLAGLGLQRGEQHEAFAAKPQDQLELLIKQRCGLYL